ncbi:uncharacterized protein I206_106024 [Kwoniella pini CBS 10737]|uniref:CBM1 domain-containing protein n=1 Tax=Kwoniella pini CBS 10737 TaxID=1296096 RepID=A0A1B9I0U9_9TREE|nr:uncharacterized protein I206_04847 [Kwoniella pini CBS 10737]OCF49159.1 hypothetical protein I206_04847 [Kwoniella pini CBS 10737]
MPHKYFSKIIIGFISYLLIPVSAQRSSVIPTVGAIEYEYGHGPPNCTDYCNLNPEEQYKCDHPELPTTSTDTTTLIPGNYGTVNPATVQPLEHTSYSTTQTSAISTVSTSSGPQKADPTVYPGQNSVYDSKTATQHTSSCDPTCSYTDTRSFCTSTSSATTRTVGLYPTQPATTVKSDSVQSTANTWGKVLEDGFTYTSTSSKGAGFNADDSTSTVTSSDPSSSSTAEPTQ